MLSSVKVEPETIVVAVIPNSVVESITSSTFNTLITDVSCTSCICSIM
jgi:hypothetical protein